MSYSFLDQQNKLSSLLGDPNTTSDDMFPIAKRKKELNRGEVQFAIDSKDLKEYATGVISGSQLAVPSAWISTYCLIVTTSNSQIVLTNDREISLFDWERYYQFANDRPYYYVWDFSGIKYIKFLGAGSLNGNSYSLYYFKKPTTELDADTDTSLHREEFREASVFYAAGQLMQQIGKYNQAEQFLAQYMALVQRASDIAMKEYVDKENAVPDFGNSPRVNSDIQGQGYYGP